MTSNAFDQVWRTNRGWAPNRGIFMTIVFVALAASYLGAWGPRFRWKGAAILAAIMIVAGIVATWVAAREAQTDGMSFRITPASALLGLGEQTLLVFSFYGFAVMARWICRKLAGVDHMPTKMQKP
jgi:hypothetical protein